MSTELTTPIKIEIPGIGTIESADLYLKSEADKVIADLKYKLDLYKRGWEENDKINACLYAELRHQKYKRCLAMAKWCDDAARLATWDTDYHRCGWYNKWMQRWLKIAEQFKEAK